MLVSIEHLRARRVVLPDRSSTRTVIGSCLLIVVLFAFACALPARNVRVQMRVNVAPDANDHRPIPVDLVFVWDKELAKQLEALTAREWFDRKTQMRRDDPRGRAFRVREWEWVPGQAVPQIEVVEPAASRRWPQRILVFANYRTIGPHRLRLTSGTASIDLLKDGILLQGGQVAQTTPSTESDR